MLQSIRPERVWVWSQIYPPFQNLNLKLLGLLAGALLIFLGIFIFGNIRKNRKQKYLLLALTAASTIQTLYILFYNELPALLENVFMGLPTIFGPLILLYTQSFIRKTQRFHPAEFINYLPFLLIGTLAFVPSLQIHENYILQLLVTVVHWGMFLLYLMGWLWQNKEEVKPLKKEDKIWLTALISLSTSVWANQSLLFLLGDRYQVVFITVLVLAAILLSFYYFRYRNDFMALVANNRDSHPENDGFRKKSDELQEVPENYAFYIKKLEALMLRERVYLDPNLTIPRMAEKMQIQPYLLSQIINSHYQQSFPDFINSYRIEDAKMLLEDGNLKISSVASDCGFNTLSSFNLAFKKQTRMTPSEFRSGIIH